MKKTASDQNVVLKSKVFIGREKNLKILKSPTRTILHPTEHYIIWLLFTIYLLFI